jgi:hypothetical protein
MLRKMPHELGATGSWSPAQSGQNPSSTELNPVVVIGQRDQARDQIVPYLGATRYSIGQQQIQTQSQGANSGQPPWYDTHARRIDGGTDSRVKSQVNGSV